MTDKPKIYVADLAAYNAGTLHGVWIDATQDLEDIMAEVQAMLAGSSEPVAEEWRIDDYENFAGVYIDEYESLEKVREIALFVQEHGEVGGGLLSHLDSDLEAAKRTFDVGRYLGEWESLEDYAEDRTEEAMAKLRGYIDYAAMARDWELNGEMFSIEVGHKVHIFAKR